MSRLHAAGAVALRQLYQAGVFRRVAHQQHVARIELAVGHALEVDAHTQPAAQGHVQVLRDAHAFGAGIHARIFGSALEFITPGMGEGGAVGAQAARWL
jgi:hypothetical protein